jgi:hypothetical protein
MWTTGTSNQSYYTGIYPTTGASYTVSGSTMSPMALPEESLIRCQLKDGSFVHLTFKEYVIFITIHGISPSECINKEDYEEKMGALTI